ncbi:MAG: DUF4386 family protein [Anaerolineales bacterium]|nr:DUF4386 family protein [Anaerolineales bacterium]
MKKTLTAEQDEKWLFRTGGVAALLFSIAYIFIIIVYVPIGKPSGAEAWLVNMASHTQSWRTILLLSVLTDILLIPIVLSLFNLLKRNNKVAMLFAITFIGLFILLDLALTWTNYASLISLSEDYAEAKDEIQRMLFLTAATYPASIVDSNLLFFYNTFTLSLGILIAGFVMRKEMFDQAAAYTGIATGILGIVAVFGPFVNSALSGAIIIASLLTTVWIFIVGVKLLKLS